MKLPFLIIIFFLSWFNATSQLHTKITYLETRLDTTENKIDSILLIGVGSTITEIFLSDLTKYFIHNLNDKKITARYYYLGKSTEEAKKYFDTISRAGYKAILFFLPRGESLYNVQSNVRRGTTNRILGPSTIRSGTSRVSYEQDFSFQLHIPGADMKKIWTASVEVICNPGKSAGAKEVAERLLYSFENNKYIQ